MVTLLTSVDPPVCVNLDSTSDDILQVTAQPSLINTNTTSIQMDLDTLAVLRGGGDNDCSRSMNLVLLLPSSSTSSPSVTDPLVKQLYTIRRLRERLQNECRTSLSGIATTGTSTTTNVNTNTINNHQQATDSRLIDFRKRCHAMFMELRKTMARLQISTDVNCQDNTMNIDKLPNYHCAITNNYAQRVMRLLYEIEEKFGVEHIQGLSDNCLSITMQYTDSKHRQHTIVFDLTTTTNSSSNNIFMEIVDQYFNCVEQNKKELGLQSVHKKAKVEVAQTQFQESFGDDAASWSTSSIIQAYQQFVIKIDSIQAFFDEMQLLDNTCIILDQLISPWRSNRRRLQVTDMVSVIVTVDMKNFRRDPPSMQWIGNGCDTFRDSLNLSLWNPDCSVLQNLDGICKDPLPRRSSHTDAVPSNKQNVFRQDECAICFSKELNRLEEKNAKLCDQYCYHNLFPSHQCDTCQRQYHTQCLRKWLNSLPTSRISFDMVIGNCPYCKHLMAVPMTDGLSETKNYLF